jgi:glycine oxidase
VAGSEHPQKQGKTVAVIGGGIIGASTAWRLAQRGFNVTVLERGTWGGEASWAGAGMLAPGGEIDSNDERSDAGKSPLAALAMESRSLYAQYVHDLREASGLPIDFLENGALDVAYNDADWRALSARAERQGCIGIKSKVMAADKVKAFWPFLRTENLAGGIFYPDDALVDPREVMAALRVACVRAGVRVKEHSDVKTVSGRHSRPVLTLAGGERFEADAIIVAAGAWSSAVEWQGLATLPPAIPVKGHLLGYRMPDKYCQTIVRHGHTYLLQRSSGFFIVGTSVEHAGFDRAVRPDIAEHLARAAGFVLPHLSETTPSEVWTGFRPQSDMLHVGRWQESAVYLAYGHYRNGILLAPVTAARLSEEVSRDLT